MASSDDSEDSGHHHHRQRPRTGNLSLFTTAGFSDQDREPDPDPPDQIVLINPYTQGTIVLQGSDANLDSLLRPGPLLSKSPHPPASVSSIESMPLVEKKNHKQSTEDDATCVICLEEWELSREMPCGHRFHGDCVERWLRLSGSCPVCRYQMPVDEEDEVGKKRNRGRREGTVYYYGYGGEREVWVSMSFNRNRDRTVAADDDSLNNNPSSSTL